MAIDTAAKRASALRFGRPWASVLFPPDGSVSQDARQSVPFLYGGILSGLTLIAGSTGGVVFIPLRFTSGRWTTTGVTPGSDLTSARSLLPPQRQQFGTAIINGKPTPIYVDGSTWYRYFDFLANVQLGGLQGLTLQDVIDAVVAAQANMQAAAATAAAVGQQTQANADSLAAAVAVIQTASLPGSEQIPPVQTSISDS